VPTDAERSHGEFHICPYCDEEWGDTWELVQNRNPARTTCSNCGKDFEVEAEYDVTYTSRKIRPIAPPEAHKESE
jgi:transcription elongation factor Elf1